MGERSEVGVPAFDDDLVGETDLARSVRLVSPIVSVVPHLGGVLHQLPGLPSSPGPLLPAFGCVPRLPCPAGLPALGFASRNHEHPRSHLFPSQQT